MDVKYSSGPRQSKPLILLVTCSLEVMIWSMSVRMEASREGRAASHFSNSDSYWALHCPCTRLQTMSLICTQEHASTVRTLCLAFLVLSWPYYNTIFLAVRNSRKMVLYFHSLPTGNKRARFIRDRLFVLVFSF